MVEPERGRRHHYIPQFYLKRWTTPPDNKLCVFSRPRPGSGVVVPYRRAPKETGWAPGLYEVRGFPAADSEQLERKFFAKLDNSASDALDLIERDGNGAIWDGRKRYGWARFILSLLLRCPQDLELFRDTWERRYHATSEKSEADYRAARSEADPETFREWIAMQPPEVKEASTLEALQHLIDNQRMLEKLVHMEWRVFDMPPDTHELLTSDRPVLWKGLAKGDGHLALPIGPRRLFALSAQPGFLRSLETARRQDMAVASNRSCVGGAVKYVFGTDDSQLTFVRNRMSKTPHSRLMVSMAKAPFVD